MLKKTWIFCCLVCLFSCNDIKEKGDLIIHNAVIYAVDSSFSIHEAMVITDGKITDLGTNREILKKYSAPETLDVKGKTIFPGFIDAHCHFIGYGLGLNKADLVATRSFNEVMEKVLAFAGKKMPVDGDASSDLEKKQNENSWITGRGWDQNDWDKKEMPDNRKLDSLFPHRPVFLTRIDGHAGLANSEALRLAGIDLKTNVEGGEILRSGNRLTGVLIDNAMNLIKKVIPPASKEMLAAAILKAQENCLPFGLTTVVDAGLMKKDIDLADSLHKTGKLKIRIYAMLSDSLPNYEYYLKKGTYKTERLNVRSFKFYADGALGSRGACLLKAYSDKPEWKGFLLSPRKHFEKYAGILDSAGFQMNTHVIGDSALRMVMDIYAQHCNGKGTHRWRMEHAQVASGDDFKNFNADIIPSVQPTHGTSDMYWVEKRLGKERVKYAYAYKDLLKAAGLIALGTDFPVEDISPFKTFFAAVARQDGKGFPVGGFQKENALTREETLRGMTIWAAYSNFEEHEKGSLERGKLADFIVLDKNIMTCDVKEVLNTKVLATYINGEEVYSVHLQTQ